MCGKVRKMSQLFSTLTQTASADQPLLFDPALPPSPSLLFYLFAERVVPPARSGTKAPVVGVKVDTARLANALLAVALWHLRTAGLVRLEPGHDSLRVTLTASATAPHRDGIEAGLLDLLTPGVVWSKKTPAWEASGYWTRGTMGFGHHMRTQLATRPAVPAELARAVRAPAQTLPETVTATITRWFGYKVHRPSAVPIQWAECEGRAKGFLAVVDAKRNPVTAFFWGKTIIAAQRRQIASLERAFAELLRHWQSFQATEISLFRQLETAVDAGLSAMYEEPD